MGLVKLRFFHEGISALLCTLLTLEVVGCAGGVPSTITVREKIPDYSIAYGENFGNAAEGSLYQGILVQTYGAWWSMPLSPLGSRNNQCRIADYGKGRGRWKVVLCFSRLDLNINGGVTDGVFEYVFSNTYEKEHVYQWWDLRKTYYLEKPWPRWRSRWAVFKTNYKYLPLD